MQFRAPSADTESNRILTESKPEVQKMSVCSKSRETRFSNTSVAFNKWLLQMLETEIIESRRVKQNQA